MALWGPSGSLGVGSLSGTASPVGSVGGFSSTGVGVSAEGFDPLVWAVVSGVERFFSRIW